MTEEELYNEYRKSDCKSFTDFLINKITELRKTYGKQRNKRIDELQKENKELKEKVSFLEDNLRVARKDRKQAYLAGAEPREKRIAELEAQIEKMKCCENCKHSNTTCECYTICTIGHYDDCKSNTVLDSLDKKDYWGN